MQQLKKYIGLIILYVALALPATAQQQVNWPTPEVEQLYKQARGFHSSGNLKQAIVLYQQAIQIAPEVMLLHRELGQAYYMAGAYDEAMATLEPIIKSGEADDMSYQVTAACLVAKGDPKKAKSTLQKGIDNHKHSGILYHDLGMRYLEEREPVYALQTWLDGIENAPGYHLNYYEAARTYMGSNKLVWAILYGEMFVNMEQHTPRANETRTMLLDAYRKLYTNMASGELPKYGKSRNNSGPVSFEEAVYTTFIRLSPVVSDGISTENLIMLRTRFLMDWRQQYGASYPFSLFARQEQMLREGYFDAYNQWLFGRAESQQLFDAWNTFHTQAMPNLQTWLQQHAYQPVAGDFYNNKEVEDIFTRN